MEREVIVTSNGRSVAILSSVNESNLEESLSAFRQARAVEAVTSLQCRSIALGTDRITILSEYHEALKRPKFQFEEDKIVAILDYVGRNGQTVAPFPLLASLPDADNEPFLEAAITGSAECLVAGNHAHFPSNSCQEVKAISPADFLKLFLKQEVAEKSSTYRADAANRQ